MDDFKVLFKKITIFQKFFFSKIILLSKRESFVTVKIFELKILMNYDVFEISESE